MEVIYFLLLLIFFGFAIVFSSKRYIEVLWKSFLSAFLTSSIYQFLNYFVNGLDPFFIIAFFIQLIIGSILLFFMGWVFLYFRKKYKNQGRERS